MSRRDTRRHHTARRGAVLVPVALILFAACGSATEKRERDYIYKAYIRGTSSKENLSKEKIDKPSYEPISPSRRTRNALKSPCWPKTRPL